MVFWPINQYDCLEKIALGNLKRRKKRKKGQKSPFFARWQKYGVIAPKWCLLRPIFFQDIKDHFLGYHQVPLVEAFLNRNRPKIRHDRVFCHKKKGSKIPFNSLLKMSGNANTNFSLFFQSFFIRKRGLLRPMFFLLCIHLCLLYNFCYDKKLRNVAEHASNLTWTQKINEKSVFLPFCVMFWRHFRRLYGNFFMKSWFRSKDETVL